MTVPYQPETTTKAGPSLAVSLVTIVLGVVLAVLGGTEGVEKIVHEFTSSVFTTPANIHEHLDTGTWEIFAAEDTSSSLGPSDVTVISVLGQRIPVNEPNGSSETLSKGNSSYLGQASFKITNAGDYVITVRGPSEVPFILSNSIGDLARHVLAWFALMGIGILLGFVGLILLIVGASRRRRRSRPTQVGMPQMAGIPQMPPSPPVAGGPAPGWYPDPSVPGLSRWWDGVRWTDQTHTS